MPSKFGRGPHEMEQSEPGQDRNVAALRMSFHVLRQSPAFFLLPNSALLFPFARQFSRLWREQQGTPFADDDCVTDASFIP